MYLLPHITPELIVLKYSVECGEYLRSERDRDLLAQATRVSRFRAGIWSRLKSIFS